MVVAATTGTGGIHHGAWLYGRMRETLSQRTHPIRRCGVGARGHGRSRLRGEFPLASSSGQCRWPRISKRCLPVDYVPMSASPSIQSACIYIFWTEKEEMLPKFLVRPLVVIGPRNEFPVNFKDISVSVSSAFLWHFTSDDSRRSLRQALRDHLPKTVSTVVEQRLTFFFSTFRSLWFLCLLCDWEFTYTS